MEPSAVHRILALLAWGLLGPIAAQAAPGGIPALAQPASDGPQTLISPIGAGNGNGNGNVGSNNGNGNQTNGNGNFGTGNGHGNGRRNAPRT
ncbi:hypothetical protein MKK67_25495 [Methylobacterium sp. J-072]|uniref:hypothetical protein n=1 Tax=Methylobacterium sp. J-072 TaxID=2836651 RepID=UPI001FBAB891|nr:hypothetical protein [Methylobacterium sp. J-072]MCJ2095826.1 hypothetical protein [Methylobacterium sp. J-072]